MNESNQTEPDDSSATDESRKSEQPAPTIDLDQFLKTCGVATGGQAKLLIQGGSVLVNGEIETRRRRKLREGDEVTLDEIVYVVASAT
jgi:ribosome-associated protein